MEKRRSGNRLWLLAFIAILIALGAFAVRTYFVSRPSTPPQEAIQAEPKTLREVVLYFGSPDGTQLIPEARDIEDCLVEADCIQATIQALISGPVGNLVPILPPQAVLRQVEVQDGTAVLDFSRELIIGHPGGSISELLTVYGLADTVAVNFPHIRQVRILVEGETVETLKGHLGLQEPIPADFSFTRPPEAVRPGEDLPAGGQRKGSQ